MATQTSSAARPALDRDRPEHTETALLASGCFWSPDALFGALPGVVATASGYAGGTAPAPTYRDLGDHTETVEVTFNPGQLSYEDLLAVFWKSHDPTRRSWKRQYRSALFTLTSTQADAARRSKAEADEGGTVPIRTEIEPVEQPAQGFHLAEGYHQNHSLRQHTAFVEVYEALFPDPADFARSRAASRVNGYAAGHGPREQFEREIGLLGLSEDLQANLREIYERSHRGTSAWQRVFGG